MSSFYLFLLLFSLPHVRGTLPTLHQPNVTRHDIGGKLPAGYLPITGYDCSHPQASVATVSLKDYPDCPSYDTLPYEEEEFEGQVVQPTRRHEVKVFHCRINIIRMIFYCGMHSHSSIVKGGISNRILSLTPEECKKIHSSRSLTHLGHLIEIDPTANMMSTSLVVSGSVDNGGKCKGASFSSNGVSYSDVVVQDTISILTKTYMGVYDVENGKIKLAAGVSCPISGGGSQCFHPVYGATAFEDVPDDDCTSGSYSVLYQGPIAQTTYPPSEGVASATFFTVKGDGKLFTVQRKTRSNVCRESSWSTEHPKIFVVPKPSWGYLFGRSNANPLDMSLVEYTNSKFVYLDLEHGKSLSSLRLRLMEKICANRRDILINRLLIARTSPNLFGNLYMDSPGHLGVVAGEVIHIAKCVPVGVVPRSSKFCYQALPIRYNNESAFLNPLTRIITTKAPQISCSKLAPVMFEDGGTWYSFSPKMMKAAKPESLTITEELDPWKYLPLMGLGWQGLYSQQDMLDYEDLLLGPIVQDAGLKLMARRMMGLNSDSQGISTATIFGQAEHEDIHSGIMGHVWGKMKAVGMFIMGSSGVILCVVIAWFVLKTSVRAFEIYRVYGLCFKILTAFISPVVHLLTTIRLIHRLEENVCPECHRRICVTTEHDIVQTSALTPTECTGNTVSPRPDEPVVGTPLIYPQYPADYQLSHSDSVHVTSSI